MKQAHKRPTLLWMSEVAGGAKIYIAVLTLVHVLQGAVGVGYALLLREVVNAAVAGERGDFFAAVARFAGLVLVQVALGALNRHFEERSRATLENRFKARLLRALLTRDYAGVTAVHSGEWMNRLTSDTVVAADNMSQILPGLAGMAVKLVGAIAAMVWLEPRFLFILVPGGLLILVTATVFRRVMKRMHKRIQEANGRLRVFISERLGSLLIVRTFSQEKATGRTADSLMEEHKAARMARNRFSNLCNIGFSLGMNGLYVLGAAFCGYGILTGTMSYGNLMAVLQLVGQIQSPFANITGYLPKYYSMLASAERLMEAEELPMEEAAGDCRSFESLGLRNASFTYQPPVSGTERVMPVVLSDMDLELRRGEYVAFTGPSGCGKSTVLKLLMCLYPLDSGERYIDGRPLTPACRSLFAYVPQGNQLLSGTIREIVAFADEEKMKDESGLQQALRIACAEEFVNELENGIDTLLGERGTGLSEGQMQRIAIARAVFSGHPVLLLDEATSSLDEATEARLLRNLREMTDRTVIIVTHRPAALEICERQIEFGGYTNE